jgi:hypothetical protein
MIKDNKQWGGANECDQQQQQSTAQKNRKEATNKNAKCGGLT